MVGGETDVEDGDEKRRRKVAVKVVIRKDAGRDFNGDGETSGYGGCVLSWIAFCLGSIAFCLQRSRVLPWKHCVLSSNILRFALEALCFVFKDLAFSLRSTAFYLQRSCVLPWKHCVLSSKILRFVSEALRFVSEDDIHNGDHGSYDTLIQDQMALRKCILSGPYKPTNILVQAVAATDDSLAI
nr:hypothetical protein [Tanacetum cinerariifolium]